MPRSRPRFRGVAILAISLWSGGMSTAHAQDQRGDARNAQAVAVALLLALASGSPARGQAVFAGESRQETRSAETPKGNPAPLRRAGHPSSELDRIGLVQQE